MKISSKGQYAIRMMFDLAVNYSDEFITIKTIAKRQDLPEKYLEQITSILSKAGFLISIRGSKGGYRLAKEPKEYTIGMILRVIEGDMAPVSCLKENYSQCNEIGECIMYDVWKELNEAINGVIDHITLEDLVERHKCKIGYDYVI